MSRRRPRPEQTRTRPHAVSRVHDGLVGDRALAGTDYLADARLRAQYETEIAPRTEAQLGRVLARVLPEGARIRRALDLGAGTGAVGRTLRARFGVGLQVVAVDRVPGPGILVADVSRTVRPAGVEGRFDLVIAAHLLSELRGQDSGARARLVLSWCEELLDEAGLCILIEPALRETSRALLEVRDRVAAAGLHIVAPCLVQGPCPALARARDWCHDSAPWQPPAGAPDRGNRRADFSYLVLQRTTPVAHVEPTRFRIVSDVLHEKGRLRVWGCGPAGRHALVLQRRDETDANRALARAERGTLLDVKPLDSAGDGLRAGPGTRALLVREPGEARPGQTHEPS